MAIPKVTLTLPHANARTRRRSSWLTKKPSCINAYTGAYIKKNRPAVYAKVTEMLASPDYSFRDISKLTKLTWPTIRAIYEAQAQTIDQQRKILARKVARTYRQLVERVEETADSMKPRDAIFGISVLHDKLALLTGGATSHAINVNVNTQAVNIAEQFQKLHQAIRDKSSNTTSTDVIDTDYSVINPDSVDSRKPRSNRSDR